MKKCMDLSIVLVFISIFMAGCSTVIIEGGGNEDVVFSKPITVRGSMYGFSWDNKKNVVLAKDKNNRLCPIHSVRLHSSYLDVLMGVASLGLYYPQTVEYKLVVPEQVDDENEMSYDPFNKKGVDKSEGE